MAPISNLVGLAFNLEDPDNLLIDGNEGVTVALLEKGHEGLKQETYHNPSNVGFPNGTLKGDLKIELDQIIGGEKNCGEGWKMLMECLAAGRGVSLPASALGTALTITYGVSGYANLRKQFNIPLSKMQGIQEKLSRMTYNSLLIDSSIKLTNNILDSGEKPSVVSAIMKQQTTERARKVLLDGMDIYAGSAICLGENNFIEKFYNSAPVGITVEGSNTLTRSLIIFGQGLNKSHPYIGSIVQSIMNDDNKNFNKYFSNMVNYTIFSYFNSLITLTSFKTYEIDYFYKINTTFTNLVNIVSLQGGKLKKDQILSGHMADIFSNLYMGYSLIYNFERLNMDKKTKEICIKMLINEMIDNLNEIKKLLPNNLKLLILGHFNYKKLTISAKDTEYLANVFWNNKDINKYIEEQIYLDPDNILKIKKCNEEFDLSLYQDIISVGEFNMD
jgi:acyl-CoA dehydrogenase